MLNDWNFVMGYKTITESSEYDVAVIGAGHAGCEAALATARLGFRTILFTVSIESVAMMPCNPNIGGTSKGHIVRELDALGGEMGKIIDHSFLQSKMLNSSKGPAVRSLRAQADKAVYSANMRAVLEKQENLDLRQTEVAALLTQVVEDENPLKEIEKNIDGIKQAEDAGSRKPRRITGIKTISGMIYHVKAVIICTGTYLRSRCIYGDVSLPTGPNGLQAALELSSSLEDLHIALRRFKTGTPARISGDSIDYSKMERQDGDVPIQPFSFTTDPATIQREQVPCWLTYTNETTHEIIRDNLSRSPLFSGVIEGTGPRYCPSIEDKIVKFPDRSRHQVFIEPEGADTNEMYIDGMSSSLPEDVQIAMYRSVAGLENAHIVRNAYAIEYDCIDARQLKQTLEYRGVDGLYFAGQVNGSSGYEEAAAQGLVAGINAALKLKKEEPMILQRSDAYIGVLIDDLVTKENFEPYRMMTSRAEYRLLLRQDNADLRLTEIGYRVGLISESRFRDVETRKYTIEKEISRLRANRVTPTPETLKILDSLGSAPIKTGCSLADLLQRTELSYDLIRDLDKDRPRKDDGRNLLSPDVIEEVEINLKYAGYIERQEKQIRNFKKLENKKLPDSIDYLAIDNLRMEARQKLDTYRPSSIGQASRIAGVTPADISVLLIYMKKYGEMHK